VEAKNIGAIMQTIVGTDPLKHEIVYNQLVSIIIKNKYQVGERLPTERVLAEKIGVNMSTLRRAFKELTDSGIVKKRVGAGTYLMQPVNAEWKEKIINFVMLSDNGGPIQREFQLLAHAWFEKRDRRCRILFVTNEELMNQIPVYIRCQQPTILLSPDVESIRDKVEKKPELFVTIGVRQEQAGAPVVLCDDNHGIRKLMQLLQKKGHKRIALFHSQNGNLLEDMQKAVWKTCLGNNYLPELCICANYDKKKDLMDSAYESMLEAAGKVEFTALLCLNDEIMLGALPALNKLGKKVPEDISVVSIGNTRLSRYAIPAITCYDSNLEEELDQAIALLDYNHKHPEELDKIRLVNPIVIERNSVSACN